MLYSMADIGLIKPGSGTCTDGDTKNACTHRTKATAAIPSRLGMSGSCFCACHNG